ncbi:hypothetical protein NHX12_027980 [Muraenolepis orangiensis]|uniref:Uncharacterized protein n=1 Tax=Muraenolepis orangiensis TaxID=630683 RepID=A0A9Q0IME7_9TELE|nr:hypothetical protein NHX12_027980 [Muraenolepis orangiensis]
MQEIEAETGEDLGSQRLLKKRKSKQKYPNLSDLRKNADTSRSRLEKKVFNKYLMILFRTIGDKLNEDIKPSDTPFLMRSIVSQSAADSANRMNGLPFI